MSEHNGHEPNLNGAVVLGGPKKARVGANIIALAKTLDDSGTFEAGVEMTPQGPKPQVKRGQYLSADDLLAEFRKICREEIDKAFRRYRGDLTDDA